MQTAVHSCPACERGVPYLSTNVSHFSLSLSLSFRSELLHLEYPSKQKDLMAQGTSYRLPEVQERNQLTIPGTYIGTYFMFNEALDERCSPRRP